MTGANQRLAIHRDHLQKENSILDLKCAALKDAWLEIAAEKVGAYFNGWYKFTKAQIAFRPKYAYGYV